MCNFTVNDPDLEVTARIRTSAVGFRRSIFRSLYFSSWLLSPFSSVCVLIIPGHTLCTSHSFIYLSVWLYSAPSLTVSHGPWSSQASYLLAITLRPVPALWSCFWSILPMLAVAHLVSPRFQGSDFLRLNPSICVSCVAFVSSESQMLHLEQNTWIFSCYKDRKFEPLSLVGESSRVIYEHTTLHLNLSLPLVLGYLAPFFFV